MATLCVIGEQLAIRTTYDERDAAKAVGARWDAERRVWRLPGDVPLAALRKVFGGQLFLTPDAKTHLLRLRELAAIPLAEDADIRCGDGLKPYQRVGVKFLTTAKRALLCDDLGLGKSAQAIRACEELNANRVLVVTRKSLLYNWEREIKKWSQKGDAPHFPGASQRTREAHRECASWSRGEAQVHRASLVGNENHNEGASRESCEVQGRHALLLSSDAAVPDARFVVANYEAVRKHEKNLLSAGFQVLVVDEAAAIKNRKAQRSQLIHRLARAIPHVFLLTGTPIHNSPADLWSLLHTVAPDRYTSFWRFVERCCYVTHDGYGTEIGGLKDPAMLQEELAPLMLRRTKSLLKLPPLTQEDLALEMLPEQRKLYRDIRRYMLAKLEDGHILTVPTVLAQLTRLRQVCCSPALIGAVGDSCKVEAIRDLLEDYTPNHKVLIFSTFAQFVKLLLPELRDYSAVAITGDMGVPQRAEAERRFRDDLNCRVLLGTIGAMGEGLNLQSASLVIFANQDWVPANNEQAIARAHRLGQENPVHVINLICSGTVDEYVQDILGQKEDVIAQVLVDRLKHEPGPG